jgi:excisionase family DNA binding protein
MSLPVFEPRKTLYSKAVSTSLSELSPYGSAKIVKLRYCSGAADRRIRALAQISVLLNKGYTCRILKMKTYSISESAQILGIDRKTLYRWIRNRSISTPKPGVVDDRLARVWTTGELAAVKKHMTESDWGKGIDRRTGKKAKQKDS